MHRTFIAVDVDPNPVLRRALSKLHVMGRAIKAVAPENLHVTLRFLGSTDEGQFAELLDAIRIASADVSPFEFRLIGVGAFPSARRPSVVWVGSDGAERLTRVVEELNPLVDDLGFQSEKRPWSCHLTLARVKARPPGDLAQFLDGHRATDFGTCRVSQIELKSSVLSNSGPRYDTIGSADLKPPDG